MIPALYILLFFGTRTRVQPPGTRRLYERIEQTNARAVGYVTALIVIDHRANVCKKWAGDKADKAANK